MASHSNSSGVQCYHESIRRPKPGSCGEQETGEEFLTLGYPKSAENSLPSLFQNGLFLPGSASIHGSNRSWSKSCKGIVQSQPVCLSCFVQSSFVLTRLLIRRSDGFPYPLDDTDKLEESSLAKFEAYLAKKNGTLHSCTLENAVKRQEWYLQHHIYHSYTDNTRHDLSIAQREEYIRAVLCLQSLPPKADKTKYPGVNNRYDDFVLTHETQAMHLHSTVRFPSSLMLESITNIV
jgi:hypothetical protein